MIYSCPRCGGFVAAHIVSDSGTLEVEELSCQMCGWVQYPPTAEPSHLLESINAMKGRR